MLVGSQYMFVYIFWFFLLIDCANGYLPEAQYQAIYTLYNTTHGENWSWYEPYTQYGYPWNFSTTNTLFADPCSSNNPWQGINCSLPCNSTLPCNILALTLDLMNLEGFIPSSIGQLSYLNRLSLTQNHLIGSLPIDLFELSSLQYLYLNANQLTGTLPNVFTNFSQLQELDLEQNHFFGSLPPSIGQLHQLMYFNIYQNQFTHTIPTTIGQLTQLVIWISNENLFTGELPSSIGEMSAINLFDIDSNLFSGVIPSSIGNLTWLYDLFLDYNCFTSTIPSSLQALIHLELLNLHYNFLTGSIPLELCQLTQLYILNLRSNQLTGSIPACLSQYKHLELFGLNDNLFSSTLSNQLFFVTLIDFEISHNFLSGLFPSNILSIQQTKLTLFSINSNCFTGVLPQTLFSMSNLYYIDCSMNTFTSSLPMVLFHNQTNKLTFLDLSTNRLTGSISSNLTSTWKHLTYISLVNNSFVGSLPSFEYNQNYLQIAYFQNNSFSGTIPESLLSIGSLKVFMSSLNCLSGTISDTICQNTQLLQLAYDGMHSSSSCIHSMFSFSFSSSYQLHHGLTGTIPPCLFSLPYLQILHLSGNNLYGSITVNQPTTYTTTYFTTSPTMGTTSFNMSISSYNTSHIPPDTITTTSFTIANLTTLILSNNLLTGTIPQILLKSPVLSYVDLSFNLFSEIELPELTHNSMYENLTSSIQHGLRLQVNHLSGELPANLITYSNNNDQNHSYELDILDGNMFQCEVNRDDLPSQDPHYDSYQCGSDNTNLSIYLWVTIMSILIITCFSYYQHIAWLQSLLHYLQSFAHQNRDLLHHLKTIQPTNNYLHLDEIAYGYNLLFQALFFITCWLFLIILPLYICFTFFYGTYHHQYIWIVSSAYLSGLPPAIILCLCYIIIICCLSYYLLCKRNIFHINFIQTQSYQRYSKVSWKLICQLSCISIGNVFFVLLINISYVLALNHGYNHTTLTCISLLISLFKLFWGSFMLSGFGRLWIEQNILGYKINTSLIIALSLFNNVIAPYVAETFASSNCFLYTIINPPSVRTAYYKMSCETLTNCILEPSLICYYYLDCDITSAMSTENKLYMSYLPPFHYNYTCSSSLLSSFAYIFIYRYIYSCFLIPCFLCFIKYIQVHHCTVYVKMQSVLVKYGHITSSRELLHCITNLLPDLLKYEDSFANVNDDVLDSDCLREKPCLKENLSRDNNILPTNLSVQINPLQQPSSKDILINNTTLSSDNNQDNNSDNSLGINPENNSQNLSKQDNFLSTTSTKIESQSTRSQEINHSNDTKTQLELLTLQLTLKSLTNGISLGEKSIIRLVTEITMFLSFGVLFPPLGCLILLNLFKDILFEQWALKRYYQKYLCLQKVIIPNETNKLTTENDEENKIEEKESAEKDEEEIIEPPLDTLKTNPQTNQNTIIFQQIQNILTQINTQFNIWSQLFWIGLWWSSLIAVSFWSFTLFDILGSAVGAIHAIWIVILMLLCPYWSLGFIHCYVMVSNVMLNMHRSSSFSFNSKNQEMSETIHQNTKNSSEVSSKDIELSSFP